MRKVIIVCCLVSFGYLFAGCSEEQDIGIKPVQLPNVLTYDDFMKPLLDAKCATAGCHSSASQAANYDMSSYAGILGNGLDGTPNAIAGNANSLLVVKVLDGQTMNVYLNGQEEVDLIIKWVVQDSLKQN